LKLLFRLLAVLPLSALHLLGALLGWSAFLASPTYRRRFLANSAQAGLRFAQVSGAVAAAGALVTELPRLWFGRPARIEWDGDTLIEQARAAGRGSVFLTPHLGCFEATAQAYAVRFGEITVLYRPARKAWLRKLVDTARGRARLATAPTTLAGVKQMLTALKAGQAVGLLPDQVPPLGLGTWAPFFGREAYTMTGAIVLLAWGERLGWGRGYRIHLRPASGELAVSPEAAAAQTNVLMEALVLEQPSQYLWGYARYKSPGDRR
jgi:KDO2-lipid IV(A) lauroyltransferase